jgi:hypothetical protein
MNYTINEKLKNELFAEIYIDFVKCSSNECWDIPNFYTIILVDYVDNQKKVFHIESEEELYFFVKNFAYRDIIYIMKCPWRNSDDLNSRFNVDCINGIVYNEYLEEFDNNEFKYFNSICNQFGVENYGEDNNPWTSRVY